MTLKPFTKTRRHARLPSQASTFSSSVAPKPNERTVRINTNTSKPAPWRALLFFTTRRHVPIFAIAIFFSIASGAANPAQSFIIGKLFNEFTNFAKGSSDEEQLLHRETQYVLYAVILASVTWVVRSLEFSTWLVFGELQARSARGRLFDGLLRKEITWYDTRPDGTSALSARIQAGIRDLQLATAQPLGSLFTMSATALLSLAQALVYSWDLTLVTISTVPVVLALVAWVGHPMQRNIEKQHEKLTRAQKLSTCALQAIETVKCYNGQEMELNKYETCIKAAARCYARVAHANALQMALFVLLSVSTFVQGFYYGSVLVSDGRKNTGQVITTFLSAIDAFQAIQALLPQMVVLEKGRTAGSMLRAAMAEGRSRLDAPHVTLETSPETCHGDIDVQNISFAYPTRPDRLIFDDLSIYIPGGQITFVIGKSGSGKSTLGQLLLRLYPLRHGHITLDGHRLTALDPFWIRSQITLIEQYGALFDDSVFQNIALARRDTSHATESEVMEAAEFALLRNMIIDSPEGLEARVGRNGASVSGGQSQRIMLARARLRDTPILILDESTSALDITSRALMMEAIRQWRRGKTTIIITHDIAQIGSDDYVFVLEDGRLVQKGYRKHMEESDHTPFQSFLVDDKDNSVIGTQGSAPRHSKIDDSRDSSPGWTTVPQRRENATVGAPAKSRASIRRNRISKLQTLVQNTPLATLKSPPGGGRASMLGSSWLRYPRSHPSIIENPQTREQQEFQHVTSGFIGSDSNVSLTSQRRRSADLESLMDRTGRSAVGSRIPGTTRTRRSVEHSRMLLPPSHGRRKHHKFSQHPQKSATMRQTQSVRQVLSTIWPNLEWPSRIYLITGFWAATVHAASSPVFAYALSKLLETYAIPGGDRQQALAFALAILAVAVIDAVHMYLLRFLLESVSQSWVDNVRSKALQRVLNQPVAFFGEDGNTATILTESLDRNAEDMRNLLGRFAAFVYVVVVLCVISILWAFVLQWKLTLIALAIGPFIYGVSFAFAQISKKWEGLSNDAAEVAAGIFTGTFANIKTVKTLTLESHFRTKHTAASDNTLKIGLQRSLLVGFLYGLADAASSFSTALIFYAGTRLVLTDTASVNRVIAVFTILMITIANSSAILAFIPQIASSLDTATRLLRLAQLPPSPEEYSFIPPTIPTTNPLNESPGPLPPSSSPDLVFQNITFTYPSRPSSPALHKLSLRLRAGTCTAIVGSSGSGKSTIAALLLKLYSPDPPSVPNNPLGLEATTRMRPEAPSKITWGPHDFRTLETRKLRTRIVPVLQRSVLFPSSVAGNIAYGLPESWLSSSADADRGSEGAENAIVRAARAAGIHEFIMSLPRGYETEIGEGGLGLSGGQVQRVALARALVREPEVLVLDEVTAGLDAVTVVEVMDAVLGLRRGGEGRGRTKRTVVMITHDVRMMEVADWVVVMERGRVVEEGRFEELRGRRKGRLREMLSGGEWMGD